MVTAAEFECVNGVSWEGSDWRRGDWLHVLNRVTRTWSAHRAHNPYATINSPHYPTYPSGEI